MELSDKFFQERKLQNHVENQTSYTLENAAMHVFETHLQAEKVLLKFDEPVLASMLEGKKIMHLRDQESFDFLPGESLILPSKELMCIDFPEAEMNTPTRCLAMAINEEIIHDTIMQMNEKMLKADSTEWKFTDYNFHFTNDQGIYQILHRLLFLFTEDHPSKDLFVNMMLQELIVRILQAENTKKHLSNADNSSNNRLSYIVKYIKDHLSHTLTVEELSQKAYMSESNFYRVFKNEFGMTPVDFINKERIELASRLLKDPNRKIKEVYSECGFESRSYFNRLFKRFINKSPGEYQKKKS